LLKASSYFEYLLFQAAQDSTIQSNAFNGVIKNRKVHVFDRRFNDQLSTI
jgi:hypothetical protein